MKIHTLCLFALIVLFALAGCSNKEFDNPIDPLGANLPPAPSAPTLDMVNGKRAVLLKFTHSWEETDGVLVERRNAADSLWTQVDTVRSGTAYTDSIGLDFATNYDYRLRAVNENGLSLLSDEAQVSSSQAPNFALAVDSVAGFRTVKLAFHYDYTQGDTLWIERFTPGEEFGMTVAKLIRGEKSYVDTMGLRFGDSIDYKVGGYRGASGIVWSENKRVTVSPVPSFNLRLTAVPDERRMLLNFAYDYAQGPLLIVERDSSKAFTTPKAIDTLTFGSAYEDTTGLRYGKSYWWRVKGYGRDTVYESCAPESLSVAGVPDYGLQLASIPEQRRTRLTFSYDYDKGGNLLVQRATFANPTVWTTLDSLRNGISYTDSSVAWGSLYWYRLSGYMGPSG